MKYLHVLTALLTVLALSPPAIQSPPTTTDPHSRTCYAPVHRWRTRATSQPRMPLPTTKTGSKASTCHVPIRGWPTLVTIRSRMRSLATNPGTTVGNCYRLARRWPARVTIQSRMHGARPDEVSLPPPALPNPPTSAWNNTSKHNNSTSPFPKIIPQPPTWALTVEDLVTAVYRIVSIVLTLLNINITLRFHAHHGHQPRQVRHAWAGVRFV